MSDRTRWIQLLLGLICMIVISSPQYVWALFTQPLTAALGVALAQLQVTFSHADRACRRSSRRGRGAGRRFGPRVLLSLGAIAHRPQLGARGAAPRALTMLYLTYGLLGGIGTGIVYIGVVGHMVQWFPDKRGLATGMVAAGYGIGALLTTFPIATVLRTPAIRRRSTRFGVVFAVVGFLAAQGLRRPERGPGRPRRVAAATRRTTRRPARDAAAPRCSG